MKGRRDVLENNYELSLSRMKGQVRSYQRTVSVRSDRKSGRIRKGG